MKAGSTKFGIRVWVYISHALLSFVRAVLWKQYPVLRWQLVALSLGLSSLLLGGCKRIPEGKDAIDALEFQDAPPQIDDRLAKGLSTRSTPTFLGLRRVYDYETLNEPALKRDIARTERELRRRGYYEARVSATRIIRKKEGHVRVEIQIDAGPAILIRTIETKGLAQLPFEAAQEATQQIKIRVGGIFDEDEFESAKQEVANSLSNRGYAYARVQGSATIDLASRAAHISLIASPGRKAKIGRVSIEGLKKLDEAPIRRILQLREGDDYSRKDLQLARAALFQLGVFSRVELVPQLNTPNHELVPIVIRVEESSLRDITLGGGARLDLMRFAVVAQGSWTHRNFLGGLREFSISTRPGLTFYPTNMDKLVAPTAVFPENALSIRLEQPGFVEGRTRGLSKVGYNIYPLLYPLPDDTDPRDERVIGYQEITSSLGAERSFVGRLLFTNLTFNWQANYPLAYQGDVSDVEGLETVRVVYPELITNIDLRDNPLQPTTGLYLTNSVQVAVPFLGGDVTDLRIHPEIRTFVPLDKKHKLIFAARLGIGMVFPMNDSYGEALQSAKDDIDYSDPNIVADQHKLLFRAFYSGGSNSNRGYPFQRIGPQGAIGFLLPANENCEEIEGVALSPSCIRPLGGFTMWEASLELRYRAFRQWSIVGFLDSSDVSSRRAHFSLLEPHVAIGTGVRYLSPVGPIRIDVGWRVPGLQNLHGANYEPKEPPDVSEVAPYLDEDWWNAFTLNILIGEAF